MMQSTQNTLDLKKYGKRLRGIYQNAQEIATRDVVSVIAFLRKNGRLSFDETLEIAVSLNVDPRKVEQQLRGSFVLPHGLGRNVRVAVFARGEMVERAKLAGADLVGSDDLAEQVKAKNIDFQICIATPDMMPVIGGLGKILGPKGLMPNPKLGTVTLDIEQAVKNAKSGQVTYRTEKSGIVHAPLGKLSFSADALLDNLKFFVQNIAKLRPSGVKGAFIQKISLSSTMGPGLMLDAGSVDALLS